jgi:hypothetical protein
MSYYQSPFDDVSRMHYADYMRVVELDKPYRGTNAYPVGSRRYSHRHFIVKDGVVQVWHANLKTIEMMRNGKEINDWYTRRHVLNIHPDNTVEFVNVWGIGDTMFMTNILGGLVHAESRRSGTVYYHKSDPNMAHPVFKGLRVSLNDGSVHPDTQYKMVYRKIIPSEKKKAMDVLAKQIEIGMVMLNAMKLEGMKEVWKDVHDAKGDRDELLEQASKNNHCLDVVAHMSLSGRSYWWFDYAPDEDSFINRVKTYLKRGEKVYIGAQSQVFKYIEREPFDFPSATWGIKVKVGDSFADRL